MIRHYPVIEKFLASSARNICPPGKTRVAEAVTDILLCVIGSGTRPGDLQECLVALTIDHDDLKSKFHVEHTNRSMNIRRHMVRLPYHAPPRRLHPTTTFGRRMLNLNYSPVISPSIPVSSPSSLNGDNSPLVRGLSTSSVQSLAELFIGGRTSSASSVQLAQGEVEVVKEEGLRHSSATLEAR